MITKILRFSRRAWIAFLIAFVVAFIMASASRAEENPEEIAVKYGVKFPIAELGNCTDISECRNFCEDPVNAAACISYAKAKGFYKEEDTERKSEILEKAKSALGCDSYENCRSFCQIPTNFEKCDAFAKREGISGGQGEDPAKKQILEKAKEVLGCDSYASCASYCSDEANRQKCSEFAKETGLRGGERLVGPGGCNSEETCKSFCSDPQNFQVCKGFVSSSGGRFEGPGGCNSESSCRSYCQEHEDECRSLGGPGGPPPPLKYSQQEMCNRTPPCSWKDNTCQCGLVNGDELRKKADEYAKYCRENPGKCTPGGVGGFESREDRSAFEKYCRENPDRCRPAYSNVTGGAPFDPALECAKYQGCAWVGGACSCSNERPPASAGEPTSGSPGEGSYSGYSGSNMSRENQEAGCRAGGGTCSWNGDTCYCQGYRSSGSTTTGTSTTPTYTTPNTAPAGMSRESQEAGCRSCGGTCSWNGDFCNCQCAGSSSGGSGYTPYQSSMPAPQPAQSSAPAPAPVQETAPAPLQEPVPQQPPREPAPAPAVYGVAMVRGILDWLLDFFR